MRQICVRFALGLALLTGISAAGPARAGTTHITYSLSGTLTSIIGPLGPPGIGTAVVAFPTASTAFSHALSGPMQVVSLLFQQAIFALSGGLVGQVTLVGGTLGGSATAGSISFGGGPLHVAGGFIHCNLGPTGCANISLPFSVPVPLTSAPFGPIVLGGGGPNAVSMPTGLAVLNVSGPAGTFLGFPISLQLTGAEVFRTQAPEPGSLALVGSALAGVLLLGASRLRR